MGEQIPQGKIVSEITGTYEVVTKNAEGEPEVTVLHKHSTKTRPVEEGVDLRALLIRPAPATVIRPTRRIKPERADKLTLAFGDAQIPFHDPRALELMQLAIIESQPDNIVFVGDMIDLPSMSRFEQRAEWQGMTQSAIDTYHNLLAQTRANAPQAHIYVVHGNHEQRLDNYVRKNAMEVLGLRRANMQEELGVLTLQYLARYDDLDIESIDGYPNGTLWLEDNLKFTHGTNTQKGGSNAAKYLREERETTIYGHSHRMEVGYRTWASRTGAIVVAAASPGALCLTDGSVPGFNHTVNNQGQVVKKSEDWQNGMLQIYHNENTHHITPIRFTDEGFMMNGKLFNVEQDNGIS